MTTPEQEKPVKVPSEVQEIPTTPEIPPEIEKGGVVKQQDDFTAQVRDDSGQPLIQTPKAQAVTVQIPATQTQLDTWSKGPIENALTWFAVFWVRIIKKAIHFGWRMISGKPPAQSPTQESLRPNEKVFSESERSQNQGSGLEGGNKNA